MSIIQNSFKNKIKITLFFLFFISFLFPLSYVFAGNIDTTEKWAWGSKVGWLNFGTTNGNVNVTNTEITGQVWSETYGWIDLQPNNGGVTVEAKVVNNKCIGDVSGFAWNTNLGWLDFANTTIDGDGKFQGSASFADSSFGDIVYHGDNFDLSTTWQPVCPATLPAPDMTAATDTGVSNTDNITTIATPDFVGDCQVNDIVKLYADGTEVGSTTCGSSAIYLVTPTSNLANGNHSMTVTHTPPGDIESPVSKVLSITISPDLPADPSVAPDMTDESDTGSSNTDNITDDTTPDFQGPCTTGERVFLYDDTTKVGQATCQNGSYLITSSDLSLGNHNMRTKFYNLSGNTSANYSPTLVITIGTSGSASSCRGDNRLHGHAWSSNIGWISFSCRDFDAAPEYGVDANGSGDLTGYAWSDNVGWIDFGHYGNAKVDLTTGKMSGDALVLSGAADATDGWDGKISLSGLSPDYNPILDFNSYEFDDFAWGDDVVGWIDFKTDHSVVTYDPFRFLFTANRGLVGTNRVPYNGSVTLMWSTDGGATSCNASDGVGTTWADSNPRAVGYPSQISETIYGLKTNTRFTLTCQNASGKEIERSLLIQVQPPTPSLVFGADDTNIPYNTSTNLNWTTDNVSSCTASGAWSGAKATGSHSQSTGNLTNSTNVFHLHCDSDNPAEYPAGIDRSVTVDVEKLIVDFYPAWNPIPYNEKIKLYWNIEFATSCMASGSVPGFSGAQDHTNGLHTFESSILTEEGKHYTAILDCDGSNGQHIQKTINIKVGNNPDYQEI